MNSNLVEDEVLISGAVLDSEKKVRTKSNIIYKILKRAIDIIEDIAGVILLLPLALGIIIARFITKENDGHIFTSN